MNVSSAEGAAVQTLAGRPPEQMLKHIGDAEPRARLEDAKDQAASPSGSPGRVPVQIYNSHGQIIQTPQASGTDFKA